MKSFFSFLLGVLVTAVALGFLYQGYLVPRNIPSLGVFFPAPNKTSPVETCPIQRIYAKGYSFCLPANHTFKQEVDNDISEKIVLTSTITWDTITIQKILSTSYTDYDNKFGDITVTYNPEKKIWEATGECDLSTPCNRFFVTSQGMQVFIGRSRWLTYIVPLETPSILVFNSSGAGYTKPLEELIDTLRTEKE